MLFLFFQTKFLGVCVALGLGFSVLFIMWFLIMLIFGIFLEIYFPYTSPMDCDFWYGKINTGIFIGLLILATIFIIL